MEKDTEAEFSKELRAQAVKLTSIIDYQDGAIVSRTLIDKKAGNITLFAFDENQALSEHTAPYEAMVEIIDGEAEATISGKTLHLEKGEMTIMPANKPHALRAIKRFKMILTMIKS